MRADPFGRRDLIDMDRADTGPAFDSRHATNQYGGHSTVTANVHEAPAPVAVPVAELTAIWERVLGHGPVGPDDDFFDLGGDSLMAVRLMLEIEQVTGCKLSPTAIYEAPTVAALTEYLATELGQRLSRVVLLKPGDPALPPLFIAPGLDGTVTETSRLARQMTYRGRIYGFQSPGIDGKEPPLDSVEAIADAYLDGMSTLGLDGPVMLVGYSFGGMSAMHLAHRFAAEGRTISLLAVIDGYPIRSTWPWLSRIAVWRHYFVHSCRKILRLLFGIGPDRGRMIETAGMRAAGTSRLGQVVTATGLLPDDNLPESVCNVFFASDAALARYRPVPFAGPILFFSPRVKGWLPGNPLRVWGPLVKTIKIARIRGDHQSMFDVGLDALAEILSTAASEAADASSPAR